MALTKLVQNKYLMSSVDYFTSYTPFGLFFRSDEKFRKGDLDIQQYKE